MFATNSSTRKFGGCERGDREERRDSKHGTPYLGFHNLHISFGLLVPVVLKKQCNTLFSWSSAFYYVTETIKLCG